MIFLYFSLLAIFTSNALSSSTEDKEFHFEYQETVHEVDDKNFFSFNTTFASYFIEFYSPKCNHCSQFEPIYANAAKLSFYEKHPWSYGKVNSFENKYLFNLFHIEEYPTILFKKDDSEKFEKFDGDRNVEDLIKFAKKQLKIVDIHEINSIAELRGIKYPSNFLLIVANDNERNRYKTEYIELCTIAGDFDFDYVFFTKSQEIFHHYHLNENSFTVLSFIYIRETNTREPAEQLDIDMDKDFQDKHILGSILRSYRNKIYGAVLERELNDYIDNGESQLILFYSNITDESNVNSFMTELAIKYRRLLHITNSTIEREATSVLVEVLRIKATQLPLVLLMQRKPNSTNSEDIFKYKLENAELSKENVENFILDWRQGKLNYFLASEDIPEHPMDEFGIVKIVGKTFDDFISTHEKDLVLAVCSKLAKRCKEFYQRFRRVVKRLEGPNIVFASTDSDFNEYAVGIPSVFPRIYLFPLDKNKLSPNERFNKGIIFEGYFTNNNMTNFIVDFSINDIHVLPLENETAIIEEEYSNPIYSLRGSDNDIDIEEFVGEEMKRKYDIASDYDISQMFQVPKNGEKTNESSDIEEDDSNLKEKEPIKDDL